MRKPFLHVLLLLIACLSVSAKPNIEKVLKDTQQMVTSEGAIQLVWWMPMEYWEIGFENENLPEEQINEFKTFMKPYTVFAVVDAQVGPMGSMNTEKRTTIQRKSKLIVNGRTLYPIGYDELNGDALNFLSMMKPLMANMMGRVGEGMEFIVFADPVSPLSDEHMVYQLGDEEFKWQLPLGSLMPPMQDPETKAIFPGNYKFNPYTGDKLSLAPEQEETES